jgi:hypothetical protein
MPTGVVLTYRDYEALPADGRRYELDDGQLFVTAAPGVSHQPVVGQSPVSRRRQPHRRGSRFAAAILGLADRSRDVVAVGTDGPPPAA